MIAMLTAANRTWSSFFIFSTFFFFFFFNCEENVSRKKNLNLSFPQLRDPEAETSKEDLRLDVRRLCHQVLTLQGQLRDQASVHRELLAMRDEASRLQDQLKGKVGWARRAVPPAKRGSHPPGRPQSERKNRGTSHRPFPAVGEYFIPFPKHGAV